MQGDGKWGQAVPWTSGTVTQPVCCILNILQRLEAGAQASPALRLMFRVLSADPDFMPKACKPISPGE